MIYLKHYNDILNNKDDTLLIESIIKKETKDISDVEGLCIYVSNNISVELNSNHIINRIVSIDELTDIDFSHEFVIALSNNDYILIDPTYKQFVNNNKKLNSKLEDYPNDVLLESALGKKVSNTLLTKKYLAVDDDTFYEYVHSFDKSIKKENIKLDNIFLNIGKGDKDENSGKLR